MTRSGFVGLAGRPNVGKSTLVNAIVGSHVAIVSQRPQTTRRAVRGVATDTDSGWQLVLVDLPGVQKPRDVLTERMQRRVERELADSDVALLVVNGEEGVGPGDRFIARALLAANAEVPVVCAVNKVDRLSPAQTVSVLSEAAELDVVREVFPVSARTGTGLEALVARLAELIPEGPYLYPPGDLSDQPSDLLLGELIREQVLNRTRDEIPHSVEVSVTDVSTREDGLVTVRAEIWADSESQKGILIGAGGRKVGEIGTAARRGLRARAERACPPRPPGQGAAALAPRRLAARPPRHRLGRAGAPRLARMLEGIDFDEDGLVPCVTQDQATGEVLMLAYMSEESLLLTLETGEVHYYSRSRGEVWHKGETSGATQMVRSLRYDCDGDAILALVDPAGPACHTGERGCFYRDLGGEAQTGPDAARAAGEPAPVAFEATALLERTLRSRAAERPDGSYTVALLDDPERIGSKVEEEAEEVVRAARSETDERVTEEAADLLYHLAVLLISRDLPASTVMEVLNARRD